MYHDVNGRACYDSDEERERFWIDIQFAGNFDGSTEGEIDRASGRALYEGDEADGGWNRISGYVDRWTYDELTGTLQRLGIDYRELDA